MVRASCWKSVGFAFCASILFCAFPAWAWYPFDAKYTQWQASRPFMYGALHNSVPEDHLTQRMNRFKAAGLNTVIWWKPNNAMHMFKAAQRVGLNWASGSIGGRPAIEAAMKLPGNAFLMAGDEPGDEELEAIGELTQWIRETYPRVPVFTNLSFMKVSHDRYIKTCQPDILSFDQYPLLRNGQTQDHYLYNLAWGRHSAQTARLPYWLFLQAYGREAEKASSAYRVPDEADLRFLVFTHLAHGGTGIMFFHYYGHQGSMIEDIKVENEGRARAPQHRYEFTVASRAWFAVRDVAPEVQNLGRALVNLRSKGRVTYAGSGKLWDHDPPRYSKHNREDGYRSSRFAGQGALKSVRVCQENDMGLLVGFFDDEAGEEYFMVVNMMHGLHQSKTDALRTVRLTFDRNVTKIERLNRLTGEVEILATTPAKGDTVQLDVPLEGGSGDLFKWHNGQGWNLRDW